MNPCCIPISVLNINILYRVLYSHLHTGQFAFTLQLKCINKMLAYTKDTHAGRRTKHESNGRICWIVNSGYKHNESNFFFFSFVGRLPKTQSDTNDDRLASGDLWVVVGIENTLSRGARLKLWFNYGNLCEASEDSVAILVYAFDREMTINESNGRPVARRISTSTSEYRLTTGLAWWIVVAAPRPEFGQRRQRISEKVGVLRVAWNMVLRYSVHELSADGLSCWLCFAAGCYGTSVFGCLLSGQTRAHKCSLVNKDTFLSFPH